MRRTETVMKIGGHMEDEEFEAALNCDLGEWGIYLDGPGQ